MDVLKDTGAFVETLGLDFVSFSDGHAVVTYLMRKEHLNSFGAVHGGVLMSLLDVSMAAAARSLRPATGVLTIGMDSKFLDTAHGDLTCGANVTSAKKSICFVEACVFDSEGVECCRGSGIFKFKPRQI